MIYILYGQDTFRSQAKLREIVDAYKKKHGGSSYILVCEGDSLEFETLKREAETNSLFQEKKLIILKRAFSRERFIEDLASQKDLLTRSPHVFLFIEDKEGEEKHPLWKFLLANATSQNFEPLKGMALVSWVKNASSQKGADLAQDATVLLIERTKGDLWAMDQELSKLAAFAREEGSSKTRIEKALVAGAVPEDPELSIFSAIDEAAKGKPARALYLFFRHMEKGDSPLYLFSMLAFQLRNLIIVKSSRERERTPSVIAKTHAMHPFVVSKCQALSSRFSLGALRALHQSLWTLDCSVKNGTIDARSALYQSVLAISLVR